MAFGKNFTARYENSRKNYENRSWAKCVFFSMSLSRYSLMRSWWSLFEKACKVLWVQKLFHSLFFFDAFDNERVLTMLRCYVIKAEGVLCSPLSLHFISSIICRTLFFSQIPLPVCIPSFNVFAQARRSRMLLQMMPLQLPPRNEKKQ